MACKYVHDPDDVLDYAFDWTEWLDGDVITQSVVSVVTDQTNLSPLFEVTPAGNTDTGVGFWISGGIRGQRYHVRNRISTFNGRTTDRTMTFICQNR